MNIERRDLAYVIGIALGDGNLSNPNGRAVRLRVTCDARYPEIMEEIENAIRRLLPENRVSRIPRRDGCTDVSCYSNQWVEWLGWQPGSKSSQGVRVPKWIREKEDSIIHCLRGLIQSDGSIYADRGYTMVNFTTVIPELASDVADLMRRLGFAPRTYRIPTRWEDRFVVRLARDADRFVDQIGMSRA